MLKTKKIICASCGRIQEKKEFDFLLDVIEGKTSEILKDIKNVQIEGVNYCSICE